MGRRKRIAIVTGVAVILFVITAYFFFPTKPCSSLKMADIEGISVFAAPPEQTVLLRQEETAKAVELLQDIKAYQRGYISNATTGQVIKFTVMKADGTEIEVLISGNAEISVNGTSYRTKYSSMEAINAFANEVLK